MKRQPSDWEKIIANETTDKGLYKWLNIRETINLIKNWMKNLKLTYIKEDIQMDNKHMKRCSVLFIIRDKKIIMY